MANVALVSVGGVASRDRQVQRLDESPQFGPGIGRPALVLPPQLVPDGPASRRSGPTTTIPRIRVDPSGEREATTHEADSRACTGIGSSGPAYSELVRRASRPRVGHCCPSL